MLNGKLHKRITMGRNSSVTNIFQCHFYQTPIHCSYSWGAQISDENAKKNLQGVLLEHLEMSQRAVLSWEYPLRQVPPLQSQTPNP